MPPTGRSAPSSARALIAAGDCRPTDMRLRCGRSSPRPHQLTFDRRTSPIRVDHYDQSHLVMAARLQASRCSPTLGCLLCGCECELTLTAPSVVGRPATIYRLKAGVTRTPADAPECPL